MRSGLRVGIVVALASCGGGGHSGAKPTAKPTVAVDPAAAAFGQAFVLGKLTIVIRDGGTALAASPGAPPRRRLVLSIENPSAVPDRAPGLAVICQDEPKIAGGSLYADPTPAPRRFLAGAPEAPGAKDTASITVATALACARPALQVSPGGATINGLPRPVLVPMR